MGCVSWEKIDQKEVQPYSLWTSLLIKCTITMIKVIIIIILIYSPNDDPDGAKELVYISGDVTAPGWVDQHSLDGMDMHAPLWMKVDASRIVQEWQSNSK